MFLLVPGDEIVAATIHLDHLNKNEVLNILRVLEPYNHNMKFLTKKQLNASGGLGSLGLDLKDPTKVNATRVGSPKLKMKHLALVLGLCFKSSFNKINIPTRGKLENMFFCHFGEVTQSDVSQLFYGL